MEVMRGGLRPRRSSARAEPLTDWEQTESGVRTGAGRCIGLCVATRFVYYCRLLQATAEECNKRASEAMARRRCELPSVRDASWSFSDWLTAGLGSPVKPSATSAMLHTVFVNTFQSSILENLLLALVPIEIRICRSDSGSIVAIDFLLHCPSAGNINRHMSLCNGNEQSEQFKHR